MKKMILAAITAAVLSIPAMAQRCDSISASYYDGWKPVASAPRDGTVVEMLETYGIAPWFGLFRWTTDFVSTDGKTGELIHFKSSTPNWVGVDRPGQNVSEDECLFWRPYKPQPRYVDPTGGAQWSNAYWCAAAHRRYDKKTDRCER